MHTCIQAGLDSFDDFSLKCGAHLYGGQESLFLTVLLSLLGLSLPGVSLRCSLGTRKAFTLG